jgi:hypothetical protein
MPVTTMAALDEAVLDGTDGERFGAVITAIFDPAHPMCAGTQ